MYQYKVVPNRTIKDIKQQERLQSQGWECINSGFYQVTLERRINANTV